MCACTVILASRPPRSTVRVRFDDVYNYYVFVGIVSFHCHCIILTGTKGKSSKSMNASPSLAFGSIVSGRINRKNRCCDRTADVKRHAECLACVSFAWNSFLSITLIRSLLMCIDLDAPNANGHSSRYCLQFRQIVLLCVFKLGNASKSA